MDSPFVGLLDVRAPSTLPLAWSQDFMIFGEFFALDSRRNALSCYGDTKVGAPTRHSRADWEYGDLLFADALNMQTARSRLTILDAYWVFFISQYCSRPSCPLAIGTVLHASSPRAVPLPAGFPFGGTLGLQEPPGIA